MTSHREAPRISKDPVADNTDLYAFVSPEDDTTVTLIANYIPLEEPAGGPNFHQFGEDVLYEISIDNDGDAVEDITYQFRFKTQILNKRTFLYNALPISFDSSTNTYKNLNIAQTYSVTKVLGLPNGGLGTTIGTDIPVAPANVGIRSTPSYPDLINPLLNSTISTLRDGSKVFAGPRQEGFYVDLGSIFDLGTLRPFQDFHLIPTQAAVGVDATKGFNVHSIALQVPKTQLTRDGSLPTNVMDPKSVIGVWASASRQQATILEDGEDDQSEPVVAGPFTQVSRLGNPLINEVIIPLGKKDSWNAQQPRNDSTFLVYYQDPELQNLLPVLYPKAFPSLQTFISQPLSARLRNDLVAVLLTGIPATLNGKPIISGFQNFTGNTQADLLRLNMAIMPATSPNRLGILGGDLAGFPNGRRVADDVIDIELQAIAGATLPLVTSFTPDPVVTPGLSGRPDPGPNNLEQLGDAVDSNPSLYPYLPAFPYLPHPAQGYQHSHD